MLRTGPLLFLNTYSYAVSVSLFTLSKKGVGGCFQKKWTVGAFIVPVLEMSLNAGGGFRDFFLSSSRLCLLCKMELIYRICRWLGYCDCS